MWLRYDKLNEWMDGWTTHEIINSYKNVHSIFNFCLMYGLVSIFISNCLPSGLVSPKQLIPPPQPPLGVRSNEERHKHMPWRKGIRNRTNREQSAYRSPHTVCNNRGLYDS